MVDDHLPRLPGDQVRRSTVPSSTGEDTGFSTRRSGFDSRWDYGDLMVATRGYRRSRTAPISFRFDAGQVARRFGCR